MSSADLRPIVVGLPDVDVGDVLEREDEDDERDAEGRDADERNA